MQLATISRPAIQRLVLTGFRLGLGWLLGRWFLVISTGEVGKPPRRAVAAYVFAGGSFVVPAAGSEPWIADLGTRPAATVQADPGPRAVRGRRLDGEAAAAAEHRFAADYFRPVSGAGEWWLFEGSGDRTPEMLMPDLAWVLPAAGLALLVGRRRRRRRTPSS